MGDDKIPPSKIAYYSEKEDAHHVEGRREVISMAVESQTDAGALDLFKKLKEEMKA